MRKVLYLITRILLGFLCCAVGVVLALNSNLGLSPWDVFHQGLSNLTGVSIGQASIIVGIIIVGLSSILGQKIGVGTLANMTIIGIFTDLIISLNFIPQCNNLVSGFIMIAMAMIATALGSYLYIGCGLGCGPRDGLMVILMKRTNKPVKLIRGIIEVSALICGYILGGTIGIGTVITAIGIGHCIQLICKMLKFDIDKVEHLNIKDTFILMSNRAKSGEVALEKTTNCK